MVPHVYDERQVKASGPQSEIEASLSYMKNGLKKIEDYEFQWHVVMYSVIQATRKGRGEEPKQELSWANSKLQYIMS